MSYEEYKLFIEIVNEVIDDKFTPPLAIIAGGVVCICIILLANLILKGFDNK